MRDPIHFDKIYKGMTGILVDKKRDRPLLAAIMNYFIKLIQFDSRFVELILKNLDLRRFLSSNILISNQEHINTSSEFLRALSAQD